MATLQQRLTDFASSVGADVKIIKKSAKLGKSWDNFTGGFATHRTGGAMPNAYWVPASESAIEAAIASGQAWIDIDVRWNNDRLWVSHDDDLSLISSTSRLVRNTSSGVMANIRQLAGKTTGGNYQDERILEFGELLDKYAHRILICVEPKNQISLTDWQKSIDLLAAAVISRGLEKSVLIGFGAPSLQYVIDHANIVKQYPGLIWSAYLVTGDPGINDMSFVTTVSDLGCYQIAVPLSATKAYVDAWKARGVQVVTFQNRQYNLPTKEALGITGSNSDYAVYDNAKHLTIKEDYWRYGYWGLGDIPATGHNRPKLVSDGLIFDAPVSNQQWMLAGDFSPLPSTFTIDLEFTVLTSGAPWYGGVGFCQQTDKSFASGGSGSVEKTGYFVYMAVSGNTYLTEYDGVSASSTQRAVASTNQVPLVAGGDGRIKITVTPTTVTAQQCDPVTGSPTGALATYNSSQWRGGYLNIGAQLNTGSMKIRRLTVS